MSTTSNLVSFFRARPETLRLGNGPSRIAVRVEVPEVWDVIRIEATPETPVAALKQLALEVLLNAGEHPEDYVVKFRGFEVLDERDSLESVGARDGSIFLVTGRRRRPVR
jgi:hypothetical protein